MFLHQSVTSWSQIWSCFGSYSVKSLRFWINNVRSGSFNHKFCVFQMSSFVPRCIALIAATNCIFLQDVVHYKCKFGRTFKIADCAGCFFKLKLNIIFVFINIGISIFIFLKLKIIFIPQAQKASLFFACWEVW